MMEGDALGLLLEQLGGGDEAAAEQAYRAFEPYLRKVVRRQLRPALRAKFDSTDVVQSVWADLLQHFRSGGCRFDGPQHLRAFLIRATRNRFIDRLRSHQAALEHERPLTDVESELPSSSQPGPDDLAQADDLWERLWALCPPEHRPLLELKRQGLGPGEIAKRTGLHEGSVRRIVRGLARKLALHPDD
jgi:RNA polymerase sigma-70 factor (ECF subfamily)